MKSGTKTWIALGAGLAALYLISRRRASQAKMLGEGETGRPSCLECVEKHLGAAAVLLEECRAGYPHRLRAIGHMHEAEDESRAWPTLCNTIREARKTFQQSGQCPDFQQLERAVAQVRGKPSQMGCLPCALMVL